MTFVVIFFFIKKKIIKWKYKISISMFIHKSYNFINYRESRTIIYQAYMVTFKTLRLSFSNLHIEYFVTLQKIQHYCKVCVHVYTCKRAYVA